MSKKQKSIGPANPTLFYTFLIFLISVIISIAIKEVFKKVDVADDEIVCANSEAQDEGWHIFLINTPVQKLKMAGSISGEINTDFTKVVGYRRVIVDKIKYNFTYRLRYDYRNIICEQMGDYGNNIMNRNIIVAVSDILSNMSNGRILRAAKKGKITIDVMSWFIQWMRIPLGTKIEVELHIE